MITQETPDQHEATEPVGNWSGVFAVLMGTRTGLFALALLMLGGCEAAQALAPTEPARSAVTISSNQEKSRMIWMTVGERRFAITLADNEAALALRALLPLTLDMSELNGNEKHTDLSTALPVNTQRPGTIRSGDLMLYGSRTLVIFYSTFKSSYSYTRLGQVDDSAGLAKALGQASARVVFVGQ